MIRPLNITSAHATEQAEAEDQPLRPSLDLTGGESVFCINQAQIAKARKLATEDPESAPKIQQAMVELRRSLTRNEQAAFAFVLIEELLKSR